MLETLVELCAKKMNARENALKSEWSGKEGWWKCENMNENMRK